MDKGYPMSFNNFPTLHGGAARIDLDDRHWASARLGDRHCPRLILPTPLASGKLIKVSDNWYVHIDNWRVHVAIVNENDPLPQVTILDLIAGPAPGSGISIDKVSTVAVKDAFDRRDLTPFPRRVNSFTRILDPKVEAILQRQAPPHVRRPRKSIYRF